MKENPGIDHAQNDRYSPDPEGPMNSVSWYDAAAYCNWLSRQEGLTRVLRAERGWQVCGWYEDQARCPASEWLPPADRGGMGVCLPGGGRDQPLLRGESWTCWGGMPGTMPRHRNMPGSVVACCLTILGLFDMLGNMWEWCHDEFHESDATGNTYDDTIYKLSVNESNPRILRGGTFVNPPADVRSAYRVWDRPGVP